MVGRGRKGNGIPVALVPCEEFGSRPELQGPERTVIVAADQGHDRIEHGDQAQEVDVEHGEPANPHDHDDECSNWYATFDRGHARCTFE